MPYNFFSLGGIGDGEEEVHLRWGYVQGILDQTQTKL